jgi:type I restriction enzyme M protein
MTSRGITSFPVFPLHGEWCALSRRRCPRIDLPTRDRWAALVPKRVARDEWPVNERLTENIVRDHFRLTSGPDVVVTEQDPDSLRLRRALNHASKSGGSGRGRPEFIVTERGSDAFVVIVECKANTRHHQSPRLNAGAPSTLADVSNYAVDGVLNYMKHISKITDVVGVAVSGIAPGDLKISTFRQMKGSVAPESLRDRSESEVKRLLPFHEYLWLFYHDPTVLGRSIDRIMEFSRDVHNFMRDYAKLTEAEKPLIVSAILLALQYRPFRTGWAESEDQALADELMHALEAKVRSSIRDESRRELMLSAYDFIRTHPELSVPARIRIKGRAEQVISPLRMLLNEFEQEMLGFVDTYEGIDIVGQFYAEFLRYTGGDGKGLGIVLTPRHLTDLFVQVIEVGPSDTVVDVCAGTGGFLIAAMSQMDREVGDDRIQRREIRARKLIGVEQQRMMYALCASNMILRGDGRSNLYRGSCFSPEIQKELCTSRKHSRPTKGLLNPPYSQKGDRQHELDFVGAMMDVLAPGGLGIAVVPMSCAIAPAAARTRLLANHTLVAAMSLPNDLFAPVGINVCALVFRAHQPHEASREPTWFGFWKDDGFVKSKHKGRQDLLGKWDGIRTQWLDDYFNRAEKPGRCVKRKVTVDDEWCAEAYMETDYSLIDESAFDVVVRQYATFLFSRSLTEPEA